MKQHSLAAMLGAVISAALLCPTPARADLVLSQLIVELRPGDHTREDVEIWNNSPDRSFVTVEPREIVDPGRPSQQVRIDPDPDKLGLLVSPARLILEPGQRRMLRIATLSKDLEHEHVYRVTVKPVAGKIQSDNSGLKIMVGYDLLVLLRPAVPAPNVKAVRSGHTLTITNTGNVSVELVDGQQCGATKAACVDLPAKRLYAGASWSTTLPSEAPAEYVLKSPGRVIHASY